MTLNYDRPISRKDVPFLERKAVDILAAHNMIYEEIKHEIGTLPAANNSDEELFGDIDYLMDMHFGTDHKWLAYCAIYFFHSARSKNQLPNDQEIWATLYMVAKGWSTEKKEIDFEYISLNTLYFIQQHCHGTKSLYHIGSGAGITQAPIKKRRGITANKDIIFGKPQW